MKPSQPAISAARKAAYQILLAVEGGHAHSGHAHSDVLLRGRNVSALSAPDRNLTTALTLGVLRWQLVLDAHIRPLLARPNARLEPQVLIALRLGAFQILLMDRIPVHAAIDESVELVKQAGHRFAAGMVNAVLRKLAQPDQRARVQTAIASGEAQTQAHPAWMVERWMSCHGQEGTRAISAHGQSQPPVTIRISDARVEAELLEAGIALEPGTMLTAARKVVSGDVTATPVFLVGRARIQDEGSQLVAELAGRGSMILDSCAAPGGKTLILAERNPQARIVACESSAERRKALAERLAPLADRVECRLVDATALSEDAEFDLALVDAPCSGTGTLGRNPEIRHRLTPDDLPRQAERQLAILKSALRAVRPGGRVVYSTCSLEPEENEQVVAALLAESPGIKRLPLSIRLEELTAEGLLKAQGARLLTESLTPQGDLRLLPGSLGTDGFFACLLER